MKTKERIFKIEDIDCEVTVEIVNRQKDIFDLIDEFTENLRYSWFDADDDTFQILYKDGTEDYIESDYDGHKIKRNNISSIVYNNACTSIVYGSFEINEYGVITAAENTTIADSNITEIA